MTRRHDKDRNVLEHARLRYLRGNLCDAESTIETPFGTKRRRYFDYIASGIPFAPIERLIAERVLPHMANTHTESNSSGRQMTFFVERAYETVSRAIGAREDEDVIIFTGAGSTSAINRLILALGIRVPEQIDEICGCREKFPIERSLAN